MFVALSRVPVHPAEKGLAHASSGDVVIGRVRNADQVFSGSGHVKDVTDAVYDPLATNWTRVVRFVPVQLFQIVSRIWM